MPEGDVGSWLPVVNLVLGAVAYLWLCTRTSRRWGEYPTEVRWDKAMVIGLFAGLLASSTVLIVLDDSTSNSLPVLVGAVCIGVVKVGALFVLWRTRLTKYRTGIRGDGDVGADPNVGV